MRWVSAICDDICFILSVPTTKMYQLPDWNNNNKIFAFTSLILDHAQNECRSISWNLQIWGWSLLRLCWKLKFYLEIDIFKVKDALRIFFSLFFTCLAHQWRWKAISNFRLCKKWNVTLTVYFQGQGYLSDFFRIQSIKLRRKTLWNSCFY